jgi:uncharacterized protein
MAKRWFVLIIALFLLLGISGSVFGIAPFKIETYVTDKAGLLSETERSELAVKLDEYAKTTSNQILVVTIPSLESEELVNFTEKLFELNKPGQRGKDNGLIFLVALKEHQVRLEVGYGLEDVLPDGKAGAIIRDQVTPSFKNSDYYGGLASGINAIITTITPDYTLSASGPVRQSNDHAFPFAFLVAIVIFFISFLGNLSRGAQNQRNRHRRGFSEPWYWGGGGFGGGGSSGGGSFGSGGGGGFSGGGGSFGGGGSSGSW